MSKTFEYQGHAPNSSLQRHSVGDAYPYTVEGLGHGDRVLWRVRNVITGVYHGTYEDCHNAHVVAAWYSAQP